jgi:hypothetical protein
MTEHMTAPRTISLPDDDLCAVATLRTASKMGRGSGDRYVVPWPIPDDLDVPHWPYVAEVHHGPCPREEANRVMLDWGRRQ